MLKNSRQEVDLGAAAGRARGSERSCRCTGTTRPCWLCGGSRINAEINHLRLSRKNYKLPGEDAASRRVDNQLDWIPSRQNPKIINEAKAGDEPW